MVLGMVKPIKRMARPIKVIKHGRVYLNTHTHASSPYDELLKQQSDLLNKSFEIIASKGSNQAEPANTIMILKLVFNKLDTNTIWGKVMFSLIVITIIILILLLTMGVV